MARDTLTITGSFQQASTGAALFTVVKVGDGDLIFNETASDTNANIVRPSEGDQLQQTSSVATQIRSTGSANGAPWVILADGVL